MTPGDKVVLDGEFGLLVALDGDMELGIVEDGEAGVITVIKDYTAPIYQGSYDVIPKVIEQYLDTDNKTMIDDVTVRAIPYYETSNESGGYTVYIANSLEG